MATQQSSWVCDCSSFGNFTQWAKGMSDAFRTLGWIQSNDTGQVVWTATVLTCSAVAVSGGNSVYTFSSYTGPDPRVGMSVTITGFATGGNNVTATITALTGGTGFGAGTFTVATTTQANETHAGSATTTALAATPSVGTYVYEVWRPSDSDPFQASCPIFIKMEYGTMAASINYPAWVVTVASSTNGAAVMVNAGTRHIFSGEPSSDTTPRDCGFSGDGTQGRLGFYMWRDGISSVNYVKGCFAVERSLNDVGVYTGDYFTYAVSQFNTSGLQRSWVAGQSPTVQLARPSVVTAGLSSSTGSYNNSTYYSPIYPLVGQVGNPMTMCGNARVADVTDGMTFSVTLYGVSRTMKVSLSSQQGAYFGGDGSSSCFVMGWF